MRVRARRSFSALIALVAAAIVPTATSADSLWDHNGSLVRLVSQGSKRQFVYERPRPLLAAAGVQKGTLLFDGWREGQTYYGTARVFSKDCARPGEFSVRGGVVSETYVVLDGLRGALVDCILQKGDKRERLAFTYIQQLPDPTAAPSPPAAPPRAAAQQSVVSPVAPPPAAAPSPPAVQPAAVPPPAAAQQPVVSPVAPPPNVANQGRRVALVIGNAEYRHSSKLKNPPADAELVGSALRSAGFASVIVKTDLTREAMIEALRDFAAVADAADWAMVYFSGHGIEMGGANYMLPVDARLKADRDVDLETVNAAQVLSAIEGAQRLRLFVLDACRDNPFTSQMRRVSGTRSVGRGLARIEPDAGTLVVYAAKHGEFAQDGEGANSPFVEAMVKRIRQEPPIEIRRLFDLVRDDVVAATGRKQQPFSYGSISGSEDFFFSR